jgi:addiction module HigA family antidote
MTKLSPIHPGEILAEDFMAPRDLNPNQLGLALRIPPNRIAAIIDGKRAITADTALRLARFFGTSAELWIRLQADYELRCARETLGDRIERDVSVAADLAPPAVPY